MKASEIFHKTVKGQTEVETRTNALSMKQRRVLILVNGENNAATLQQLSLCEDTAEILGVLLDGGFIAQDSATSPQIDFEPEADKTASAFEVSAREFMCNTLLTFANRVRVAKLIDEINDADNIDALRHLVKPWYHAISETPGGMYQADDLRQEVEKIIAAEAIVDLG